ncbi:hypothetical protein EUGRSUZ_H01561 [Eucalyptus grandis]|uniref:Uncharacterized protein n=2 Tax=Eucalyptus grandis TaxID=71139 RepID=A0ACC3JNZ4_EUCGR|nr:hypothetical protein EUGRSUZ_H01561 [Eucalyptus grandis]
MQLYSYERRQSKYIQSDDSKLMEFGVLGFMESFLIWHSDKIVCVAKFYASLSPISLCSVLSFVPFHLKHLESHQSYSFFIQEFW